MRFLILFFISFSVFATEDHKVFWTAPVEREDNTPLPRAEISHFNMLNAADGVPILTNIPGNVDDIIHSFPFGTHNIVMTSVSTDGRESVYSQILTIKAAAGPKGMTNLQSERVTP